MRNKATHLFLAVSTDFIVKAPLVPGSFTYSSLGGGMWEVVGVAPVLRTSAWVVCSAGNGGRSSERRPLNALLMIRGMNRDERDEDADRCDALSGSDVEMSVDGEADAVLGRAGCCTVEAEDWLDRNDRERCIGERVIGTAAPGAPFAASDALGTSAWPMSTDHRRRRLAGRSVWLCCVGAECSEVRGLEGSSSPAPMRMGCCG